KARAAQLDFADGEGAVKELFLVVVDDRFRNVQEVVLLCIVATHQTQLAERNAAEQTQACGVDVDRGAGKVGFELSDEVAADYDRIGPVEVAPDGGADGGEHGKDQASDQAFAPGHGSPSARFRTSGDGGAPSMAPPGSGGGVYGKQRPRSTPTE